MKTSSKFVFFGLGAALTLVLLTVSAQGQASSLLGPGKDWVQIRGKLLCADCTVQELRTTLSTPASRLYQLNHHLGPSVIEVQSDSRALPYRRIWLRGADQLSDFLSAEENMFKHIEVSGLLREYMPTSGVLDFATVRVVDNSQENASL